MPWCGYWGTTGTAKNMTAMKPRESMSCSSMMQQLMERMRSTDECSPAAMCQRIMGSFRTTSEDEAETTPEPPTSPEERARGEDGELRHGCCGQQPERPKGT